MGTALTRTRRWKRVEYEQLIEQGFFQPGERLELIGGDLVVREPQGTPHAMGIRAAEDALRSAFGSGWDVRVQLPVALDDESEPEPDVSVVPGTFRDYRHEHPSRPVLVVEVSESSLGFDREYKGSLYARNGVADFWIINLVDNVLEVYREPAPEASAPYGWRYRTLQHVRAGEFISPLAAAQFRIAVADLLP
jgi:Uma2 family endonuclease